MKINGTYTNDKEYNINLEDMRKIMNWGYRKRLITILREIYLKKIIKKAEERQAVLRDLL